MTAGGHSVVSLRKSIGLLGLVGELAHWSQSFEMFVRVFVGLCVTLFLLPHCQLAVMDFGGAD